METKTFLNKLLSSEGYYCLFAASSGDNGKRVQKFYTSIDDLVYASANMDAEGLDVYFGLATFDNDKSRRLDNVKHLKSFFLDLDCGPSKDFTTQEEAIGRLQNFCKINSLPKPMLVNSGRGVHVYWVLSEAVCYDDWLPVATRLKALCADQNFPADPAVTADGSRILRVINTHNNKGGIPKEVSVLGMEAPPPVDFDAFSELLGGVMIPVPKPYKPVPLDETMQNLIGNQENVFKDIVVKSSRGEGCAQIWQIISQQETISEPLWRAGLSIAKFCKDADKAMVKMSEKHPEYSLQETQKKVDLIRGPYTCPKFDEFNPDVCTGCPHKGKIKSPIVLGKKLREAEVSEDGTYVEPDNVGNEEEKHPIPEYPFPYVRGANGGVYIRIKKEAENGRVEEHEELIYRNDIYVTKRIRDPVKKDCVVIKLHLRKDSVREFVVPMSLVSSREEFRRILSGEGVTLAPKDYSNLMTYILKWVEKLQDTQKAEDAHVQFGWTEDMNEFILGKLRIRADSIESNPPTVATSAYMHCFKPKGTLEEWKETIKFWEGDRFIVHQFGLGVGFGSPLMNFLTNRCVTFLYMSSESGHGKSLLQYAAAGIYGLPEGLVPKASDTKNFLMNRAEVYHSLPFQVDEVKNQDAKYLSDFIYETTSGTQRGRLSSQENVERYQGRPWKLLMTLSSNDSIIDKINAKKATPQAEAQRILECYVPKTYDKTADKHITDPFEAAIKEEQYGTAAIPYIQFILQNKEYCRNLVRDVQKKVDIAAQLTMVNRFWSEGIACTIAGLVIAKQIGLHNYDIKKIFKWATTELVGANKTTIEKLDLQPEDLLAEFFSEHYNSILVIRSDIDGRTDETLENLLPPDDRSGAVLKRAYGSNLVARYEPDTNKFYIKISALKLWCADKGLVFSDLKNKLTKKHKLKDTTKRLTKGTNLIIPAARVWEVEIDLPDAE